MGAKNSSAETLNISKVLPPLPDLYIQREGEPHIIQHPELSSARVYLIMLNKDQIEGYVSSLRFRKKYSELLIQILYGNLLQDEKQYKKIKAFVQYLPLNLQQLINVNFRDLLSIFYKALKGFQILYKQFGAFAPDPRMIAFNEDGQVKIWCNIKYSKSKPQISYQMFDEERMISSLVQIFNNKIDIRTVPLENKQKKLSISATKFEQAIKIIESYATNAELNLNSLTGINNLLQSGYKIKQSQVIKLDKDFKPSSTNKKVKFQYKNQGEQSKNKPQVNFSFNRCSSTTKLQKNKKSVPKITFNGIDNGSKTNVKVNFLTGRSADHQVQININPHLGDNTQEYQKKRCNSLVKFSYN